MIFHNNNENIFFQLCDYKQLEVAEWLLEKCDTPLSVSDEENSPIDIHVKDEYIFRHVCRYGYFEVVKWLLEVGKKRNSPINIHANNEEAFRLACYYNHREVIKLLYELSETNNEPIDIHANNEEAFIVACRHGYHKLAKWLYEISKKNKIIDIHCCDDKYDDITSECVFSQVCYYEYPEIAKWLYEISIEQNRESESLSAKRIDSLCESLSSKRIDIHYKNDYYIRETCTPDCEIAKWLLSLSDTKYIKENLSEYPLAKEELKNRESSKLDLFIYLSKNEKIKKLLDMHAINIIFEYI